MLQVTDSLIKRVDDHRCAHGPSPQYLRVAVDSGGCSGFQYSFSWTDCIADDDDILEDRVLVDPVSLQFLKGSTIDFVTSLMGSDFRITNPNAASGCGCGISFAIKTGS